MDLLIEITRSLYHLDLFRRSFRNINFHQCCPSSSSCISPSPSHSSNKSFTEFLQPHGLVRDSNRDACLVCSFKNIFTELNISMRESVLDPPLVCDIIESRMRTHMNEIHEMDNTMKYKGAFRNNMPAYAIRNLIANNGHSAAVAPSIIYDYIFCELKSSLEKPAVNDPNGELSFLQNECHWKDFENMKTEYSLTKICLECRTTTHIESISQYIHQVDSSNLITNDWPSFEFGLKSALDCVEFCVKPNCHGQTKIFRCLRSFPDMIGLSFTDTGNVLILHILPSILRPYLIFESSTTTDMNLKSLVLHSHQWNCYGSLFFHSRLQMWIFIDARQIVPLNKTWTESRLHPVLNGYRAIVVFYCHEKDSHNSVPLPQSSAMSIHDQIPQPMPIIPLRTNNQLIFNNSTTTSTPAVHAIYDTAVLHRSKLEDDRIYENWPVDSDSGQGSTEESSSSCSYGGANYGSPNGMSNPKDSLNGQLHRKPSTLSTNSSSSMISSSDYNHRGNHISHNPNFMSNGGGSETKSSSSGSSSKNKFATIRRKGKLSSSAAKPEKNFSISVPDLRAIAGNLPNTNSNSRYIDSPPVIRNKQVHCDVVDGGGLYNGTYDDNISSGSIYDTQYSYGIDIAVGGRRSRSRIDNNPILSNSIIKPSVLDISSRLPPQYPKQISNSYKNTNDNLFSKHSNGNSICNSNISSSNNSHHYIGVPAVSPRLSMNSVLQNGSSSKIRDCSSSLGIVSNNSSSSMKMLDNNGSLNGGANSNKKVSFNCEVTLVNDQDDEYIPHAIFQSVINKLQIK